MGLQDLKAKIARETQNGGIRERGVMDEMKTEKNTDQSSRAARTPTKFRSPAKMLNVIKPSTLSTFLSLLTEDDIVRAVEVQREAMEATTRIYDVAEKCWIIDPDHKTRANASAFIISHKEGLPMQKQMVLSARIEDAGHAVERALESPALREQLRLMLDRAPVIEAEIVQESGGEKECSTTESEPSPE